jgi:hypothetical protein
MTRDEMIDVLSVVAAATRRTIGESDVTIWMGVCGDVPKDFALTAIRDHMRDQPGVWLEPGHIFQRWRAFRIDKAARESRDAREARQAALDARLVEAVQELDAAPPGPLKFGRRTPAPELAVACPWLPCRAKPGNPCVGHDGKPLARTPFHPARTEALTPTQPV